MATKINEIQDLYDVTDSEWDTLLNAWREQNDAGNGEAFDFGDDAEIDESDITIANMIDRPDVILIAERGKQAIVKVVGDYQDRVLMACDANGIWLCDVSAAWQQIAA